MNSTQVETPYNSIRRRREVPLRGYVIVLGGTVIWAMTGIVIKILLTRYGMDSVVIAFWRVFIVTAFMFLVLLIFSPRSLGIALRDVPMFALYGLIGVGIHQLVWIGSVQYNGAAVATVLIYISPAFVALFAWRYMHEKMDREKLAALGFTIAGCVLVARAYDQSQIQLNLLGLAAGIGSGLTLTTYTLMGRLATRRYSAWTAIFYAFLFGTISLLPLGLLTRDMIPTGIPLDGWATLIFLALGPTLGGFGAYTIGLTHLPASVASILAAFEPVTTATIAYFVFGEQMEPPQLFGAGLVLLSIILLRPKNGSPTGK